MAVEVRKSMPQVAHTIHLKHPISPSAPGSIQWSIRRATIWLCYSPGNCLFPWCRCKPVYIGALRNPQNATWSSNHLGLELFAEVSTYPSWSRIFFKSDGPTFGVVVKTLLGDLMVWRCTWTGDSQVHLFKIFPLQISNLLANCAILSDVSSQSKVSLLGASNDLSEKEGLSSLLPFTMF